MKISPNDFALKRSIRPYIGEMIIIGTITVGLIITAFKKSSWSPIEVGLAGLALVVISHITDFRYRVFWRNEEIESITTNNQMTTIRPPDISKVVLEYSDIATVLSMRRPSQRITIYSKDNRLIDVSLKHFVTTDIKRLLQEIHNQRPDLTLPKI
jgi:hypothetical protein